MNAEVGREMVRLLFIVARDQLDLWHHLKRDFAQEAEVEVILDRRRGERRQRVQDPGAGAASGGPPKEVGHRQRPPLPFVRDHPRIARSSFWRSYLSFRVPCDPVGPSS